MRLFWARALGVRIRGCQAAQVPVGYDAGDARTQGSRRQGRKPLGHRHLLTRERDTRCALARPRSIGLTASHLGEGVGRIPRTCGAARGRGKAYRQETQSAVTRARALVVITRARGVDPQKRRATLSSMKVEKLGVAGYAAPRMREKSNANRVRRVALTDAEGKITGYVSLEDVQKGLLKRQQIEFDTEDGVRPKYVLCQGCGDPIKVPRTGYVFYSCAKCRRGACEGCGKAHRKDAKRRGTKLCKSCQRTQWAATHAQCVCGKAIPAANKAGLCIGCIRSRPKPVCACGAALSNRNVKRCKACSIKHPRAHCAACGALLSLGPKKPGALCKPCRGVTQRKPGYQTHCVDCGKEHSENAKKKHTQRCIACAIKATKKSV